MGRKNDLKTSLFLSYKNLSKSKTTTIFIILVLAISFVSITFFAAIIDGLGYEFEEGMIRGETGHLMIEPHEDVKYIENSDKLIEKIQKIPGVVGVSRRLSSNIVINHDSIELGIPLYFIEPERERQVSNLENSIVEGESLSKKDSNGILIGSGLIKKYAEEDDTRKRLDISTGEKVNVSFSSGYSKEFKVRGIYSTGSKLMDEKAFMNYEIYSEAFGESKEIASQILIILPERGYEEEYRKEIIKITNTGHQINPWQTKMGTVKEFVGSLQITNQITGIIGLLTAFVTVYIIIFVNVTNKRKQIGTLKAMGIKKKIILSSYVFQSLIYGVVGIIVGNLLINGMLSWLSVNPLSMPVGDVTPILDQGRRYTTSLFLILASVFAGYFPSKKAADENILSAIFGG